MLKSEIESTIRRISIVSRLSRVNCGNSASTSVKTSSSLSKVSSSREYATGGVGSEDGGEDDIDNGVDSEDGGEDDIDDGGTTVVPDPRHLTHLPL